MPESTPTSFELGLYSFGERMPDPQTSLTVSPQQRIHDLLEEIELADQVGLDVYGVGSITAPTTRCRRPPWCWPPPPPGPPRFA